MASPQQPRFVRPFLLAAVNCLTACSLFTSPAPQDQRYVVVKVGSKLVPAQIAELPNSPTDPSPSGCWVVLTEGEFGLHPSDKTFGYFFVFRHSCTGGVLWNGGNSGKYEQVGTSFTFRFSRGAQGGETVFSGRVAMDTLIVIQSPDTYYFKRAPLLDTPSAAPLGAFSGQ
jgi:hypothetical protein